jgi:S1-C subfamily serine protease
MQARSCGLRVATMMLIVSVCNPANAVLRLEEVQSRYANSTVFIAVKFETLKDNIPISGCKKGSAFFVSNTGYLVTSNHLFTDEKNKPFEKIDAVMGKVGENFDCDKPIGEVFELELIKSIKDFDAALLKSHSSKTYSPIPACYGPTVPNGASLYVLGFPLGLPLSSQVVTKGNETKKLWQISGKFDNGSSGGPVMSTGGFLVGLVFGGYSETNVSFVVPLRYFSNLYQLAGSTLEKCGAAPQKPTESDNEPDHDIRTYGPCGAVIVNKGGSTHVQISDCGNK